MKDIFYKILIILVFTILIYAVLCLFGSSSRLDEIENQVVEVEKKQDNMWLDIDNMCLDIDNISEGYTTIWVKMYGEDSWYEKPEDKEKVHKEIMSMGE